jgi:hypothetical protein
LPPEPLIRRPQIASAQGILSARIAADMRGGREKLLSTSHQFIHFYHGKDLKDMKTHNTMPVAEDEPQIILLGESVANSELETDIDILEIEEAKNHFDDPLNAEEYWAGRLLANRKSTRIAA